MSDHPPDTIAFFDFDGTITNRDTFIRFHLHSKGPAGTLAGILMEIPVLAAYSTGLVSNESTKQRLFSRYWAGTPYEDFNRAAKKYSISGIDSIARPIALEKINMHKEKNHEIVVVTASLGEWITPWCITQGIYDVICTTPEVRSSKLTGRFSSKNCFGPEKVRRIKEKYDLSAYERIFAYGDSPGDRELLDIADVKYYRWERL